MTTIDLTPIRAHILLILLFDMIRHRAPLLHIREAKFTVLPSAILTRIPRIRHRPPLQMPLLDTPNDIHAQLPVLLQRILPMLRNRIAERQIARNGIDHHLAHLIVLARVRVHVLHPP